jgi:hypothetical protein
LLASLAKKRRSNREIPANNNPVRQTTLGEREPIFKDGGRGIAAQKGLEPNFGSTLQSFDSRELRELALRP